MLSISFSLSFVSSLAACAAGGVSPNGSPKFESERSLHLRRQQAESQVGWEHHLAGIVCYFWRVAWTSSCSEPKTSIFPQAILLLGFSMLCPPGWACLRSCLPSLSPSLSLVLSRSWSGTLCPPGPVSHLVFELVWDAVSGKAETI